ncbi:hypothetical protein RHGRI_001743 [Rhododendron griersonianum]|uniref:RING-type domain-containing protein n=1 Tax=Rhododendron griersonianum TaxID=479676 RepID=A0AAV6LMC6_9ERIC|nr:hypothetical protein RHGRI_001743 [Rhododendron griersonianum]
MSSSTTLPGGIHPPPTTTITTIGLGYSIAIALGFLFLLSTLLLSSYLCCRRRRLLLQNPNNPTTDNNGITLPRIIFVAEDDDAENQNAAVGLDPTVINSYPKFPFSKGGTKDATCSICLCEYRDGEMLRMLPDCRHYFHLTCVDAWLKMNASCPVCRNSPLPTPVSTPLSEVVPLSQYAGGGRRRS